MPGQAGGASHPSRTGGAVQSRVLTTPDGSPETRPAAHRAPSGSGSGSGFRGDVEGLRAVAVLAVLAYHAEVDSMTGGYVGVDVFFVISGFLITGLLLRELERHGKISLPRFYARRMRRLLPATVLVLCTVLGLAWLLMSPVERETLFEEVIASAMYLVNWQQAAEAVEYSALGTEGSPVQHFWSLAVEEQFYLVWPLLLIAVAWVARRSRPLGGSVRARLGVVLGVGAVVSFWHATQLTQEQAGAAYFSTATRAWELAAGGLVALVPAAAWRWSRRTAGCVATAGLGTIVLAVFYLTDQSAFPAPWALLPVLGTAAVIAAGCACQETPVSRLLSLRPVRYVGRISYSWYLWHWPAIVFATIWFAGLSAPLLVAVVVLSWIPAALTHRFVEEPFRRARLLSGNGPSLQLGFACVALPVLLGLVSMWTVPRTPLADSDQARGAEVLSGDTSIQQSADAVRPQPEKATEDRGKVHADGCLADQPDTQSDTCVYGDPSASTTVVLFGDSHAMQYSPALSTLAKQREWRLVVLTKSSCSPADVTVYNQQFKRAYSECDSWREHSMERIAYENPDMVITGNQPDVTVMRSGTRLDTGQSAEAMREGYVDTMRALQSTGAKVVALADNPHPTQDIPSCVSKSMDRLGDCAFSRQDGLNFERANKQAAREVDGVKLIDPLPVLCPDGDCPAVIGNTMVYRNSSHITPAYMNSMLNWLDEKLPAAS